MNSLVTTPRGANYEWWTLQKDHAHSALINYIKAIEMDQSARRLQWLQYARMYQNQNPMVWYSSLANSAASFASLARWSSRNVIKSCIDTATSKIGKSKPRPVFLTENGSYEQQQKAKGLTQFLDGQFDQMEIYSKGAMVFRDGGIFGMGGLKFMVDTDAGTVECERVIMDEIMVDDGDGIYGKPLQLHHTKLVSKSVLRAKFPRHEKEIDACRSAFESSAVRSYNAELVKVYETYKLPSKSGAKDGRFVISIESATLKDETWEKDYFPFVFWRWCPRVSGFWGLGIAEELYGTQLEINKLLQNIAKAQDLIAVPRVWVQAGSLVKSRIDNQIGGVNTYTGQPPTFNTATAMTGEIYNHLKWLVQSAFDQIGISEMSATGQKPSGLDSGVAIREYEDVTSERFMVIGQAWEQFYLSCAKMVVDLNKDLMALGKNPSVKIQDKDFLETIDWKSVDLAEDKYILRCFAANILPTTPAGRLAKVQELIQAQLIPIEEGLKLLDFPDFKAYRNQALASSDLTDKMIDQILNKGKYMAPEPQMDLARALSVGQLRYLEAKLNNVPAKRLALMSRWIEAVKSLTPAAPVATTPMAPMENPLATPEAAPQSPLIPLNG